MHLVQKFIEVILTNNKLFLDIFRSSAETWLQSQLILPEVYLNKTKVVWISMNSDSFILNMNYSAYWGQSFQTLSLRISTYVEPSSPNKCYQRIHITVPTPAPICWLLSDRRVSRPAGRGWLYSRLNVHGPPLSSQVQNVVHSSHGEQLDLALLPPLKRDHLSLTVCELTLCAFKWKRTTSRDNNLHMMFVNHTHLILRYDWTDCSRQSSCLQ